MKPSENKINKQKYWENNIKGFSGFYDTKSEEKIPFNFGFGYLYKKIIFPIEKKYMLLRHKRVSDFIEKRVEKGMKVADIGCGSGIYTKKLIEKGAFVYAFDYVESALNLTKSNLNKEELSNIEIRLLDITNNTIPEVDIAISIGVLPYIENEELYLNNILPYTNMFLFNFLNRNNVLNIIRRKYLKFLDVRTYSYHNPNVIVGELGKHNFKISTQNKLATGYIIEAKNNSI